MFNKHKLLRIFVAAIGSMAGGAFAADGLTLNIGTDYSSGKYGGTDRTTIWSVPISAKYTTGPVAFRLATSWLSVSGTGVVIPSGLGGIGDDSGRSGSGGGGGGGSQGVFGCTADNRGGARKPEDNGPCAATATAAGAAAAAARRTESGMGDVVASVIFTPVDRGGFILDLIGKAKFATASDTKGLGSGKNDYAVQVEAEQSIGRGFVNGGVGYKWLGDPAGISLRNVVYGSIGGGYKPTGDTTVGLSYDYSQSARSGGTAPQDVSLYASQWLTKNIKLNGFVFKGLSNASADWGAGVNLGYRF